MSSPSHRLSMSSAGRTPSAATAVTRRSSLLNLIRPASQPGNLRIGQPSSDGLQMTSSSWNRFYESCQSGDLKQVVDLVDRFPELLSSVDESKQTPLTISARYGHLDLVNYFIKKETGVEKSDVAGWSALTWAAYMGHMNVLRVLIDAGANPNHYDEKLITPLIWAAGRGHYDVCSALVTHPNLKKRADVDATDKYGLTALVWAIKKNRNRIASFLIETAGANVNVAGINGWTPLLLAAKLRNAEICTVLIGHGAMLNATDKDGMTALMYAAKDGEYTLVRRLLEMDADVTCVDRANDSVLILGVKSGSVDTVRLLIGRRKLDIDHTGYEHKTALFIAAEKGYSRITQMLIDANAKPDIQASDGATALIAAIRRRHYDVASLLISRGASLTASDRHGDTALHLAVRTRQQQICSLLLRNPRDNQLLYLSNKNGETPFSLDQKNRKMLLNHIFGARRFNETEMEENLLGYDLYANALAGVLSDPNLVTPITVGLFAKWGSGKAFLIRKLEETLLQFSYTVRPAVFRWNSWPLLLVVCCLTVLLTVSVIFITSWQTGLLAGGILTSVLVVGISILQNGMNHSAILRRIANYCAVQVERIRLLFRIALVKPGCRSQSDQLKFLFTDYTRLSDVGGELSLAQMVVTLARSIERDCGPLVFRAYRAFRTMPHSSRRLKSVCGIPLCGLFLFWAVVNLAAVSLWVAIKARGSVFHYPPDQDSGGELSDLAIAAISLSSVSGLIVVLCLPLLWRLMCALLLPTNFRIRRAARKLRSGFGLSEAGRFESLMDVLKQETRLMADFVRCVDCFQNTLTRLVVVVDCLDNCEQEKAVRMLDTVSLLFADNSHSVTYGPSKNEGNPFVTVLAMDPWIFVRGGVLFYQLHQQKIIGLESVGQREGPLKSNITGWSYLKNHVHLPFYLHAQVRQLRQIFRQNAFSRAEKEKVPSSVKGKAQLVRETGHDRDKNQHDNEDEDEETEGRTKNSTSATRTRARATQRKLLRSRSSRTAAASAGANASGSCLDLTQMFNKSDYFSDVNPSSLRRLLNILALSGRLLRSYVLDFNWLRLGQWLNMVEQWPLRSSWILVKISELADQQTLESDGNHNFYDLNRLPEGVSRMSLQAVYNQIKYQIPDEAQLEGYLLIDKNPAKLDVLLASIEPALTVREVMKFLPATINLDPYLRKIVSELAASAKNNLSGLRTSSLSSPLTSPPPAHQHFPLKLPPMRFRPDVDWPVTPMKPAVQPMASQAKPRTVESKFNSPTKTAFDQFNAILPANVELRHLSTEDVCRLIVGLDLIDSRNHESYCSTIREQNLSGLVLELCDLDALKPEMRMTFGDWMIFKSFIDFLRNRPRPERPTSRRPHLAGTTALTPSTTTAITEENGPVSPSRPVAACETIDERDENSACSSCAVSDGKRTPNEGVFEGNRPANTDLAEQVQLETAYLSSALQRTFLQSTSNAADLPLPSPVASSTEISCQVSIEKVLSPREEPAATIASPKSAETRFYLPSISAASSRSQSMTSTAEDST